MSKAKKSPPKKKPVTALAVRKAPKVAPAKEVVISGLPASVGVPVGQLGELATVGNLGMVELKLTPEEDKCLSEPVNPADIRWKPRVKDGPPEIPYLPHPVYTKWFCRAFGRTGWALVPTQKPVRAGNLLMREFILYIHGVPVASAVGEQEYYETNKQQTYGDVIESLHASALRRCAKHLNVGLEMWDKEYLDSLPRPKGTRRVTREEFHDAEYVGESAPASSQLESPVITPQQLGRIAQIVERTQRNPAEVTLYLKKNFSVPRAAKLLQKDYAKVCRDLEARGDLPLPGDGHQ